MAKGVLELFLFQQNTTDRILEFT